MITGVVTGEFINGPMDGLYAEAYVSREFHRKILMQLDNENQYAVYELADDDNFYFRHVISRHSLVSEDTLN